MRMTGSSEYSGAPYILIVMLIVTCCGSYNLLCCAVVVFGAVSTGLAFVVSLLGGTVVQAILTFASAAGGPTSALFLLGLAFPFVNWKVGSHIQLGRRPGVFMYRCFFVVIVAVEYCLLSSLFAKSGNRVIGVIKNGKYCA